MLTSKHFPRMGIELKIFCLAGNGLRAWETECIRRLRAVRGVHLQGWMRATETEPTGLNDSWSHGRFRRWERESEAQASLEPLRHGLHDTGLAELASLPEASDLLLLLGGASRPAAFKGQCWTFRHGDGAPVHGVLPAMREGALRISHAIMHLADARDGTVLRGCFMPMDTEPVATAVRLTDLASRWPADLVRDWIASEAPPGQAEHARCAPLRLPGAIDMLRYQWRRLTGSPPRNVSSAAGAWNIGVLHQPVHALLQEHGSLNVRWLPSPSKGRSRLEPFGYTDAEGELNTVYRKCHEDGYQGVIARLRPKPDNILKRSRTMHDGFVDPSYPYTLSIEGAPHTVLTDHKRGEVLLLPVNAENDGYSEGQVLLGLPLHAPTLFQHQGRWWLLGTRDPVPDAQLHAFHAPNAQGPFVEHACSPLKCDARSARPAGTPFVVDGVLYRPALDAADPHRLAVRINRVTNLDPERFQEETVRRIDGFPATAYGMGVRTLSAIGNLTLVDGLRSPVLSGRNANAKRSRSKRRPQDADDTE